MMNNDLEAQRDEIVALESIYEDSFISSLRQEKKLQEEAECDADLNGGVLSISMDLNSPFHLSFVNKITKEKEKHCIQFLPPLNIHFTFPSDYPSRSPPDFTLSCKWLNNFQLSQLCKKLDEVWEANRWCEIMFTWAQHLKEGTFSELLIEDELELEKVNFRSETTTFNRIDRRAIQDLGINANLFLILKDFDEKSRKKEFDGRSFFCKICFENKIGNNCIDFWPCHHVYCRNCIKQYFEVQINEGNIQQLVCPENQCKSEANPKQVEELVSSDLYRKWDEMLLSCAIFSLDNIQPCPRKHCQYPVTIEDGLGSCPMCSFVFCSLCRFGSHGIEKCKFKSKEAQDILDKYMNGEPHVQKELEDQYGKKYLSLMVDEYLTFQYIEENAKECPKCRANIEKIDGCNKMTCNRCNINFCWLCEKILNKINPYTHFNNPDSVCFNMLFHGLDAAQFQPPYPFDQDEEDEEEEEEYEGMNFAYL